jgi:xylitol oxidase
VGIHFTWKKDWAGVRQVLPMLEEELAPLNARPHWGKLFTMAPEWVQALFPRLPDFRRLLLSYDPHGKFRNAFLDRYIFGTH